MPPRETEALPALDIPVDEDGIPILTEIVEPAPAAADDMRARLERITEDLILELVDEYRRSLRAVLDEAVDQATDRALERLQQRLQALIDKEVGNGSGSGQQ